jgi:hypothetical protein
MGLHVRNVAIAAGVPDFLVPDVVNFMKNTKCITTQTAKQYLQSHNIYNEIRHKNIEEKAETNLSSFYVEIDYSFLKEPLIMNILLNNKIQPPLHFTLRSRKINSDDKRVNEVFKILFGEQKNEEWLHEFIKFINHFDINQNKNDLSELNSIKYKLKMMIILTYVVTYNLLKYNFNDTQQFIRNLLSKKYVYDQLLEMILSNSIPLYFGLSVILELSEIMKFYLNNYVKTNKIMIEKIFSELELTLVSLIKMSEIINKLANNELTMNKELFDEYFECRIKRLNATVMILSDLAFNEELINEQSLNSFLALGRYCEIKLTLLRDYSKYNVSLYLLII